jgi:hypothetical protein|tara:strand:+ start:73 stop:258 length:186 start_codon:yes stop_codon:yes gene_type:complete
MKPTLGFAAQADPPTNNMVRVVDIIIEINFLILSPRERLKEPQIGSFQNPAQSRVNPAQSR